VVYSHNMLRRWLLHALACCLFVTTGFSLTYYCSDGRVCDTCNSSHSQPVTDACGACASTPDSEAHSCDQCCKLSPLNKTIQKSSFTKHVYDDVLVAFTEQSISVTLFTTVVWIQRFDSLAIQRPHAPPRLPTSRGPPQFSV